MKATIAKQFTFDAAHYLDCLGPDHKCAKMHGHTYVVELRFRGPVNPHTALVIDYAEIALKWQPIHDLLDHKILNDVPGLSKPSTEHLATWIALRYFDDPLFDSVRVTESSTTWCEVNTMDFSREYARTLLGIPID